MRAEVQLDLYSLLLSARAEDVGRNHDEVIVASRALRLAQRQAQCWGIRWWLLQAGYVRTGAGRSGTCGTRVIGCRNPPLIPNSKRYFNVVPLRGFSHRALSTIRR